MGSSNVLIEFCDNFGQISFPYRLLDYHVVDGDPSFHFLFLFDNEAKVPFKPFHQADEIGIVSSQETFLNNKKGPPERSFKLPYKNIGVNHAHMVFPTYPAALQMYPVRPGKYL